MTKMHSQKCQKARNKSEAGFSLIELAIVMIIIGLLATPLIGIYGDHRQQEKIDNTDIAISAVNAALGEYYMEHGYYPCPADRTVGFNTPDAGIADCTKLQALSVGTCSANSGMCLVSGNPGPVYVGGVPYADLKIKYSDVVDGYRNVLTYSVTVDYTDPAKANLETRVGSISLQKDSKDSAGVVTSQTINNIFYLLTSHGEDNLGAFDVTGALRENCEAGYLDGENCDLDAEYLDRYSLRTDPFNAEHYDDRVEAVAYYPTSIWLRSADTPGAIYNTNMGAIGIGIKEPDASVKLDVNGAVKANNFRGQFYCDENGNNCFETNTIAGTGISCATGYMKGIYSNTADCESASINVTPHTCGLNEYVSGIDSGGNIQCAPLP